MTSFGALEGNRLVRHDCRTEYSAGVRVYAGRYVAGDYISAAAVDESYYRRKKACYFPREPCPEKGVDHHAAIKTAEKLLRALFVRYFVYTLIEKRSV